MNIKGYRKKLTASVIAALLLGSGSALASYAVVPGPQANGTGVTSYGWNLSPAGKQLKLGDKPFGGVLSPDHKYLVVSNEGLSKSLQVVDLQQQKVVSEVTPSNDNLWFGVAFSPDGKTLYTSGLNNNIQVYHFENGNLTELAPIVMKDANNPNTTFSPAGMTVSLDGKFLYVANNLNNSVSRIDLASGQITATTPVGKNPYTAFLSHDGSTLYATNWGESSVTVLNAKDFSVKKTIAVGLHPSAVAENPVNGMIYVANTDSDEISVIEPKQEEVAQTLSLAPYRGAQTGSMPNALTISKDGQTLYVSNAGNNDIAVIDLTKGYEANKGNNKNDVSEAKVKGLIPTAWYPSGVYLNDDGSKLFVINAKGLGYGPNAQGQYIGNLVKGTLSSIDLPSDEKLKEYTKQVKDNNQVSKANGDGWFSQQKEEKDHPIPQFADQKSPIKHVIYIIKENRTYDQILGDLGKGNGDPSLTEFGKTVTPNIHKLADKYVTLDNFYSTGEASADGHYWANAAIANDHQEKEFRTPTSGPDVSWRNYYDYEGWNPANYPKAGFLWTNAARSGVSFRDYGEFIIYDDNTKQWVPTDKSIGNNYDPNFAGWDFGQTDLQRYDEWDKEYQTFVKNGNLPQLETILLPGDHTAGTDPNYPTPQAMVAQNDYAVGKIVETVSHSPYWKDTAIFVIEDDAQSGPDHVESHRTEALVISPYTQTGKVDSTFYDTTSMVRTMEMILGMKPMTQFDASATPMLNAFTNHPDFTPYQVGEPQQPMNQKNDKNAPMAAESQKMNFSKPDANDPEKLNLAIWKATKGDQPYPGANHSKQSK